MPAPEWAIHSVIAYQEVKAALSTLQLKRGKNHNLYRKSFKKIYIYIFFFLTKTPLKWQFCSNLVQQKQTCEFDQVHPIDVLGITMNYESFSCPISLIPASGCCVPGCAVSRPCGQNVLISCAWPEAMRLTLNPETGLLTRVRRLCEPVTSLSQIPSPLLSSSLPWVGVITLKSQSVLNLPLPISSSHCISQH